MIGLAPRGRVRPWKLAAAVTALQRAFPWTGIRCEWSPRHNGYLVFVDRHGALLVSPALLERCADEAAVMASITKAVPTMRPEIRVELTAEGRTITPMIEHPPVVHLTWSPGSSPPSGAPALPRWRRRYS